MTELERFMRDVDADDTLSEAEVKARAMSELGYKVTATQIELVAAENELLDHEELELVA